MTVFKPGSLIAYVESFREYVHEMGGTRYAISAENAPDAVHVHIDTIMVVIKCYGKRHLIVWTPNGLIRELAQLVELVVEP